MHALSAQQTFVKWMTKGMYNLRMKNTVTKIE